MDPTKVIRTVKVRYDEFPDRNSYIYGLSFEGANKERIVDLNFVNYRSRED